MVDYEGLDPNIREAVKVFNENGFETCSSCQGGEGHVTDLPTVSIRFDSAHRVDRIDFYREVYRFVRRRVYNGFTAELRLRFISIEEDPEEIIDITFWSQEVVDQFVKGSPRHEY